MRFVLARNVVRLLERDYKAVESLTARQRKFAEASGIGFGTIQRMCKAENGPNLETIETVAHSFGLSLYQLFLPALDPKNPQVVRGATIEEQRLYRLFKQNKLTPELAAAE
jgi:transcriptional regulator with XRE-family HTH domain